MAGCAAGTAVWIAASALTIAAVHGVQATPPPAGTSITNQASATFTDTSGVFHTVTSNVVQTTVQQVACFDAHAERGAERHRRQRC